jgi:hypothetical protein
MPNFENDAFYYPGEEREPLEGHEDKDPKAVKGTYPNPRPSAHGETAMDYSHPAFGDR